jgi:hypothetical protein
VKLVVKWVVCLKWVHKVVHQVHKAVKWVVCLLRVGKHKVHQHKEVEHKHHQNFKK